MIGEYQTLTNADAAARIGLHDLEDNRFWNSSGTPELRLHRIHAYPAKFPAFITTKALHFAKTERLKVRRVADIFCGCGTVAFEARRENIDFWGCDINPVATLIARTKSGSFDVERLADYFALITKRVKRASAKVSLDAAAVERLDTGILPSSFVSWRSCLMPSTRRSRRRAVTACSSTARFPTS